MWNNKSVSLIFPTFREKTSIYKTIQEFSSTGFIDEIIVVDNNAEEGTAEEVKRTKAKLIKETKQGLGQAIKTGINNTKADIIIIAEPDGTFDGKDIIKLLAYSNDFETVFGSRTHYTLIDPDSEMFFIRRILNFVFGRLINSLFLCSRLTDVGCILRLTTKKGWFKVSKECNSTGAIFITEWQLIAAKNKVRFIEIPVRYQKRIGKSSLTPTLYDQAKWAVYIFYYIWKIWFKKIIFNK